MNRSQRRAAVIKRSIAAGLLCAGIGVVLVVPAAADAGDGTGGAVASNNDGAVRGHPAGTDGSTGAVAARPRRGPRNVPPSSEDQWHPRPFWCEFVWPDWPIFPPLPYTRNRNVFIVPFAPVGTPVSVVAGVADTGVHASTALGDVPLEAASSVSPAAAEPVAGPSGAVQIAEFPAAAPPPPTAPPPVPAPENVAPAPNRAPVKLPDLPSPNLGQIAVVALPGLAGIAALTALGGFLGYRQAKAGYVLRAAGTARFLQ